MSLTTSLHTGKSALLMRQTQMSVIGNNIANADKAGYHRQSAEIVENYALDKHRYQIGTGSRVETVVREFDAALEGSLRTAVEQEAYYSELSKYMQATEEILAIEGKSIMTDSLTEFSNSLQDLANDPGSEINRRAFLANSERVAATFNQQYSLLTDLRDRIASASGGVLETRVEEFNNLTQQLADVNDEIMTVERSYNNNQQAVELRDKRDMIASDLAKLADVTITEELDGTYTLEVDSQTLVSGSSRLDTLNLNYAAGPPAAVSANWVTAATPANLTSGSMVLEPFQFVQARIVEYEEYAEEFAEQMNLLHSAGFDAQGPPGVAGTDIFDATTAGNMQVLISDPDLVAASDNNQNVGDGDNALNMWNGLYAPNADINNDSLIDRADRIVDFVAVERNKTEDLHRSAESSVELFTNVIAEKSGVSVDEEMVHMLESQRAFQGAAKFISTIDQLTQTVINLI